MLRENQWGLRDPVHEINTYYWGVSSFVNKAKEYGSNIVNAASNTGKRVEDFSKGTVENAKDAWDKAAERAGEAVGKSTSLVAPYVLAAGDYIGNTAQKVGDKMGVSDTIGAVADATGVKSLGNQIRSAYERGAFGEDDDDSNAPVERQRLERNSEASARGQEAAVNAQTAQSAASANALQNASAGINRSRAGMLGSNAAQATQTADTGIYKAAKQQTNTTNADYLTKMKQADALDTQAKYMQKAVPLATASSALSGAANGLQLGMMTSDENAKEADDGIDDNKLNEAIAQFKQLYKELQQLKGGK